MKTCSRFVAFAAIFSTTFAATNFASADALIDVNHTLGGTNANASGISHGGSIIVGASDIAGDVYHHAFKYSNGVMTDLGTLGGNYSSAYAASSDGSVIVGDSNYVGGHDDQFDNHAFKYSNGVMTDLGTLGGNRSSAYGVSADGSVIVGGSSLVAGGGRAFKYSDGVMTNLGTLGGGDSSAQDVSADGGIIIGSSQITGSFNYHGFKYTDAEGMVDIGTLGGDVSFANAISADGSTIVGRSTNLGSADTHAFKYVGTTMTDLGTLGGSQSDAYSVSSDGAIIVGYSQTAGNAANHAFKYTTGVMTDLGTLGGTNSFAHAISADGTVITGRSQTVGDASYHVFVTKVNNNEGNIVDVNNTNAALAVNATQLNSILNLNSTLLYTTLNQDATLFGKNNISVAVGGRYAAARSAENKNDSGQLAGTLKIAYRFNPKFRAGIFFDQSFSGKTPSNFALQNSTPMTGIFATFTDKANGVGAQIRLAAAYNSADLTISRSVLSNTEAGRGNANLTSRGALVEAAYGWQLSKNLQLQPYTGLRFTQVTRDGYTETSGADFPITFQRAEKKSTTAFGGVRLATKLSSNIETKIGFGFERDLSSSLNGYAGNISSLGSFNLSAINIRKNRSFANVGIGYSITKLQNIGLDLFYTKQSLSNADAVVGYLHYTVGF